MKLVFASAFFSELRAVHFYSASQDVYKTFCLQAICAILGGRVRTPTYWSGRTAPNFISISSQKFCLAPTFQTKVTPLPRSGRIFRENTVKKPSFRRFTCTRHRLRHQPSCRTSLL